jgi:DNA mismatch endonuclease Vsr
MARVRGKNTAPEIAIRRLVHAMGFRYRLHRADIPGTPDLAFINARKVIFVHGCFWHRHPGCPNTRTPKSNVRFWRAKLAGNRRRDRANLRRLAASGRSSLLLHLARPWRTVRDALADLPMPSSEEPRIANHRFQPGARPYPGHTGSALDWPAKTLKAGVHGVPGGENMVVMEDGSVRYFSVREAARLRTFPDDYQPVDKLLECSVADFETPMKSMIL